MEIPKLNTSVTRAAINGQIFDIIDRDELFENQELHQAGSYAVKSIKNEDVYLPIKGEYSALTNIPGVYSIGNVATIDVMPDEAFQNKYIPDTFISMSNSDDIKELIKKGDAMKKLDEPFITSPDNITNVPIRESDQPEMRALKMALNAKHIDIDKYAGRFGENFPNDKRQLKNNNATLKIIKRFCENCDMEAILIFKDKNPDVPNPMNKEVVVSLTEPVSDEVESLSFESNENDDDEDFEE